MDFDIVTMRSSDGAIAHGQMLAGDIVTYMCRRFGDGSASQ